jgi:predicted deacylase
VILDGDERGEHSLTGYARVHGATGVWIETGGKGTFEHERAQLVATGLQRAMGKSGVLAEHDLPYTPGLVGTDKFAMISSGPGVWIPAKRETDIGKVFDQGEPIGAIVDPVTHEVLESFTAPYPRSALSLLRPTLAALESAGKVCAMTADVTAATS